MTPRPDLHRLHLAPGALGYSHRTAILFARDECGLDQDVRRSAGCGLPRRAPRLSPADRAERPACGPDAAALPADAAGQGRRGRLVAGDDLELAKRLHLAQSTVTELVNRAAAVGLVRRSVSTDDARVVYVELTDEGEERFAEAFKALLDERRRLGKVVAELSR